MHHLSPDSIGLHSLIVHSLFVLLLLAPLFVIAGIGLSSGKRRLLLASALTLMVLGTALIFAAVATGEATRKVISPTPAFKVALEEHLALAETTRELFVVLTLGLAALLLIPRRFGRELGFRVSTALLGAYVILYATGALFLIHTALQGGRLVRELGAKTTMSYQLSEKEGSK